ncbi:hypothetical protein AURDEDRAFT_111192 [Auricularia subglabra TFB-10046 SS5]|nr:hypothetical protein AURDEDRAFT_111192 [Auricularia subglabra TFB-10046 SS5]
MRPRVWASTRPDFCETVPLFRSYQGGVYSNIITHGYMVGGTAAPRDVWLHGGKLIISHGGGGQIKVSVEDPEGDEGPDAPPADEDDERAADDHDTLPAVSPILRIEPELEPEMVPMTMDGEHDGTIVQTSPGKKRKGKTTKVVLKADQTARGTQVDPLIVAAENQHPILLLAAYDYERFPYDLGEKRHVVLGWYWIKAHWEEAEPSDVSPTEYFKRLKLAFQWIEGQGEPWWFPAAESSPPPQNPRLLTTGNGPSRRRKLFSMDITKPDAQLLATAHAQCCKTCGTVSPTVYREGWMCLASICRAFWRFEDGTSPHGQGLQYDEQFVTLAPTPAHLRATAAPYTPSDPPQHPLAGLWCRNCGVATARSRWVGWECSVCKRGIRAPHPVLSAHALASVKGAPPCGIRKIHEDSAIRVEHFAVSVGNGGSMLWVNKFIFPLRRGTIYHILGNDAVNHLADDILERYQTELADAPLMRRHKLVKSKLAGTRTQYFSQNFGVPYKYAAKTGTTVTFNDAPSAVLDSRALIQDRAKIVVQGAEFNELLVALYLEGQQMNYHNDGEEGLGEHIASLSLGAPAKMHFRALKTKQGRTGTAGTQDAQGRHDTLLKMSLNHGDVVVMHGVGLQNYYEHSVVPEGFRVVATARFIRDDDGTM